MPSTFESSRDSEDKEGEIKEEKMEARPAVHPSVVRAQQILQPPAIRDTPRNSGPFPNIQLSLPPSFAVMVTQPGDNHFVTDSDTDQDMLPLTRVSNSSESDDESDMDSETDEEGVPGRSVFQLHSPEETARRDEGQGMLTSTYLPAGPPSAMAVTQSPLLFRPATPMPEGMYCPPPLPTNQNTNTLLCGCQPHVYLTCIDMPFETSSLPEIREEPGIVVPSKIMMPSKPDGIKMYIEDHNITMQDVNKEEGVFMEELHQELMLRAAKVGKFISRLYHANSVSRQASVMLPEYTDSIYSSDTSESESDEDDEEHAPLILNDLLWANIKNSHYVVETVRLSAKTVERLQQQPYEPYYYACQMSESDQYGANSTLSYLICRHDDHRRNAWHYEVLENSTIPSHVFHHVDNPLEYAVVDVFRGIRDNSTLDPEDNSLLAAGNTLYDELRGHDEWKIAMLGIKIYGFMHKMDVNWNHWVHSDARFSPSELDQIQQQILLAHHGWHVPEEFKDWKDEFVTREVSDNCAGRHIMKPDEEDIMLEGLIPRGILLRQQWRGMVDTLSHKMMLDTSSTGTMKPFVTSTLVTCFFFKDFSNGRGELSNTLRYVRGAKPIMADEMRTMFTTGYIDAGVFYDDEGRYRAFHGDEHDLHYYDEEDEEMY
ncbi:hypothetical protein EDD85DRAFT_787678 [Armillaria nabsnona]|nr:hypothetical protein EDD85DRAFT_787678 [Armillaria nabsnona]